MEIPQGSSIVSPQTFPYIVAAFTSLVGLLLFIDVLRGNHGTPDGDEPGDPLIPVNYKTLLIVAATVCFSGVAYGFGSRKIIKDFFVSVAFSVIVYISFTRGLNINLPSGFFEGIFGNG